jgi:hypothetical protein|tara:strand:+ start:583 stop:756 length:174 start_codon:yes stop_codon:yes gene_type:complete
MGISVPYYMKVVKVKHKITTDFILDLYEKAKTLKGEEKKKLIGKIELLSKYIGDYLV